MLYELFALHAKRDPDRTALVLGTRRLSYAELDRQILLAAGNLRAQGVGPGSIVATCLDNTIENVVLLFALAKVGAVVATLDAASTPYELDQICRECNPAVFLCEEKYRPKVEEALKGIGLAPLVIAL